MIDWLRRLPDFWVFVMVIGPLVGLTAAAPYLGARLWKRRREGDGEGFDSFLALAAAAAVLLAFTLVQVDTIARAVDDAASKEATAINASDRVLTRFGEPRLTELRPVLRSYATALVEDEWPQLQHGGRSSKADDFYVTLSRSVRAFEPSAGRQTIMYGEILKYLDDLADLREQRINAASEGLPKLFWVAMGLMLLLFLVLVARLEPRPERLWTTTALAAALGVIVSLIVIVDAPFHGDTGSVKPDAITRALAAMTKRS